MNSSDGMLIVNVSAIQAVAIAAVTYYFGAWLRKKVPFLEKYSVPSPVVGGMLVALVLSCLEYFHFMKVNFDTLLQTLLMLAFFTTIGLSASLKIVTEGGKLLVS
ncbi:sodium/glutamate symporter [Parasutterella excrementihominis]